MVRTIPADDRSTLTNADVSKGDTVRITVDPEADFETIEGEVTAVYAGHKIAVQVDGDVPDGKAYIVNDDDKTVRVGNHADGFDDVDARPVYVEFPSVGREGDVDTDDTLVYENTVHDAHEKTGKEFTRTKTVEHDGEVYAEGQGVTGFRTPEHTGVFFVDGDGVVEYDPADESRGRYEVGTDGRIE